MEGRMALAIGSLVGSYQITARVGVGGMGEVFRARDNKLKRDVAIKSLPDSFAGDPGRAARFQQEAEVLASLNHPNIAAIYDLIKVDGSSYLVLEFVEGEIWLLTLYAKNEAENIPRHILKLLREEIEK